MTKSKFAPRSDRGHKRSLLRNQVADLIIHGAVVTTETKAKVLKKEAERVISRAKKVINGSPSSLAVRRRLLAYLPKKSALDRLFGQVAPQFKDRAGGYVRVVKLPPRRGDRALLARVEFVVPIKKEESVSEKQGKKGEAKKVEKAGKTKPKPAGKKPASAKRQAERSSKSKLKSAGS